MRGRMRMDLVWLVAILAGFGALCFATLGLQSFDSGETITAGRVIHPSLIATWHTLAATERSGPVYYTLAWAWSRLFGTGEVGLRSLSMLAALGTIVALYFAGRELAGRRAGVIAALLAACNPDVFWFSQEARSYPFYICLSAVGVYFFLRALRRPSARAYAGWGATACVALATHYFSAFFFGTEAVILIASAWRGSRRGPVVATAAWLATGLALVPLALHQERTGRINDFGQVPVLERGASALIKFAAGQMTHPSGAIGDIPTLARIAGPVILALFAAALFVLWRRARGEERRLAGLVAAVAGVGFAVPLLAALGGQDYVEPYNLDGALPLLLLLVAVGAEKAFDAIGARRTLRFAPAGAIALPMAAMVVAICAFSALQRDDWRGLGQAVLASRPADVIVAHPPEAGVTLSYYLGDHAPNLTNASYPCGVRARRIVAVSDGPQEAARFDFHRISSKTVDGRWSVDTYEAPRAVPLDARDVEALGIVRGRHSDLVDGGLALPPPATETATERRLDRLATVRTDFREPVQSLICGQELTRSPLAGRPVSPGRRPGASRGTRRPPRRAPLHA
jgi:dolichyl-phosphate-mannose-protein mannosyltransferase